MPAKNKLISLHQILQHIPGHLVKKLSQKHGVDKKSRSFSPWSHVVSMIYAQLAHSLSLNDVCDSLKAHCASLFSIRGAKPPSRNGLSHANQVRTSKLANDLFWSCLERFKYTHPKFGYKRNYKGLPRRFKRVINIVDSTTIQLVANSIDWAKHRRRKAAAKCHMRLNIHTFLPNFALVSSAKSHDSKEARELCSNIKAGEIVIFDKAYIDFKHLSDLNKREVFWVSRKKDNMLYKVVGQHKNKNKKILQDFKIKTIGNKTQKSYYEELRLIKALVKVDGKEIKMEFLTNNMEWAASSVCDLYKSRWSVEVFFKTLKQNLKLADFLGYSANAVQWQIWMALLTYVLIRLMGYIYSWKGSFTRLFTILRSILWNYFNIKSTLDECSGTAKDPPRMIANAEQLYFPGFETICKS